MRICVTCPVCKRMVRKQSEKDELTVMVSTEDDSGRIVYYHWDCWTEAMGGSPNDDTKSKKHRGTAVLSRVGDKRDE